MDKFLIMQYKATFIFDLTIAEAISYAIEAYKMREEDRLYALWTQLATSPYAQVPSYEEFKGQTKGDTKKEETVVKGKKLGTLKGQDLTRG